MQTPIKIFLYKNISYLLIILFFYILPIGSTAQNSNYIIDTNVCYVDGSGLNVRPGDTVFIKACEKQFLKIKNFKGDAENYIVFINSGGQVVIKNNNTYGFVMDNCQYFHLTGTGDTAYTYGIKVAGTLKGASGLSTDNLSSDFEIDHVEVCNSGFAGIMSKTDPRCDRSSNRGNFTQYNSVFHDNYIHNTKGEGFYIGNSFYNGWCKNCYGKPDTLFPHELIGVKVYNNIIDSTTYDGIQIDCAVEDCEIYDNIITHTGIGDDAYSKYYGMEGIIIGGGTKCKCYNNIIKDGKGSGINVFGLGDIYIFNNLIVNMGLSSKMSAGQPDNHHPIGIFCDDRTTIPGASFNFINNTIIRPREIGIRIWSLLSKNNRVYNNVIIDPGGKSWNPNRALIDVTTPSGINADTLSRNNFLDTTSFISSDNPYFIDTILFHTKLNCIFVDSGICVDSIESINFDLDKFPRPINNACDAGCYEFSIFPFKKTTDSSAYDEF